MKFLYAFLALLLVALTIFMSALFFRDPDVKWGVHTLLALLGCVVLIPLALRAWRGGIVDDRLAHVWLFLWIGVRSLMEYAKKREASDLVFGSLALLVSLGALIALLRHPSPPPPEPQGEERITGPFKRLPAGGAEDGLGCAPWGGLLLLIGSFVGYVVLRGSPVIWVVTGGIGVALLFSGLIRRG